MKSTPSKASGSLARVVRVDGAGVIDGGRVSFAPGSVLMEFEGEGAREDAGGVLRGRGRVVAVGTSAEIDSHPLAVGVVEGRGRVKRLNSLLIPGLVNAHAHLDLTHVGPREFEEGRGFLGFVDVVRRERRSEEEGIAQSVRDGVKMSLAGGVVAVGDIAGAPMGRPSLAPWRVLREELSLGVSYLEFFAWGVGEGPARERLLQLVHSKRQEIDSTFGGSGDGSRGVRFGVQPHAPTTVARSTFEWLIERGEFAGLPLATHLAETIDEREFVGSGTGAQRRFLESLGLWTEAMLEQIGQGRSPVGHLEGVLARRGFLCAHLNDVSDADIEVLARTGASVVYCPRASEYFGAERVFGGHRYREMMSAGVNVCLGTDSVINLPGGSERISTWDEAGVLLRRDGVDARTLLKMMTVNGARGLGLDTAMFEFKEGREVAGIVSVEVGGGGTGSANSLLETAVRGQATLELLYRWEEAQALRAAALG